MNFKKPAIYLLDCGAFWKVVVGSKALVTYTATYSSEAKAQTEATRLNTEVYPKLAIVRMTPEGSNL